MFLFVGDDGDLVAVDNDGSEDGMDKEEGPLNQTMARHSIKRMTTIHGPLFLRCSVTTEAGIGRGLWSSGGGQRGLSGTEEEEGGRRVLGLIAKISRGVG